MKRSEAGGFGDKAEALRQEVLVPALKKALESKPLLTIERVYLGGGAVWAMASFMAPGGNQPYLVVTPEQIAAYRALLQKTPGEYPTVDLSSLGAAERTAAEKEIERVKKTFSPAQLRSGAES